MRAWQRGDRGRGALTLHRVDRPDLVPGPGKAIMKVRATGLGARPVVGASTTPVSFSQLPNLIARCLTIKGLTVGSRRMFEDFVHAVEERNMKPVIDRVFGFDEVLDATRYYETGAKIGKVVIKVA